MKTWGILEGFEIGSITLSFGDINIFYSPGKRLTRHNIEARLYFELAD